VLFPRQNYSHWSQTFLRISDNIESHARAGFQVHTVFQTILDGVKPHVTIGISVWNNESLAF
jgi:hypothetical protein